MSKRYIVLLSSIVLIASFVYIVINIFTSSEERIFKEFDEHQLYIAKDLGSDINDNINSICNTSYKVFSEIVNLDLDKESKFHKLFNLLSANYIEGIAIYNSNGKLISSTAGSDFPVTIINHLPNKNGYQIIRGRDNKAGKSFNNYFNLLFRIKNKVSYKNKAIEKSAHILDYKISSVKFLQYLLKKNNLNNSRNSHHSVWIIDNKGNVIIQEDHPDMAGNNFYKMNKSCFNCHKNNSYLNLSESTTEGSFRYSLKNRQEKTASFSTVNLDGTKWKIVVTTPSDEISQYISNVGLKTILLIAIFISFMLLISIYIVRLYQTHIKSQEELKHLNEKNKLLQQITESEEKYKELFENNPLPMWLFDSGSLKFLTVNNAAIQHYGFTKDEFLSMTLKDIRPKEEIPGFEKNLAQSENGVRTANPSVHKKKDGSTIIVEIISHPLPEKYGIKTRLVMAKDITEQYKLHYELTESEDRYKQLVEGSPDAICVVQNGIVVFINVASMQMLHAVNENEIIGQEFAKFLSLNGLEQTEQKLNSILNNSNNGLQETTFKTIDDIKITVETKSIKILYKGKPAVQIIARDITERKKSQEMINLLAHTVMSTDEGISITDLNNNILFVNKAFTKMYGYNQLEVIGKNIDIFRIHNNGEPTSGEIKSATIKKGWSGELINKKKDGSKIPIYLTTSAVLNEYGKPYALVGVMRDITERKLIRETLERSEKKYKKLFTEMKSGFALNEIILDEYGEPADYITLEINEAFESLLDSKAEDIIGKKVSSILPHEELKHWLNVFGPVATEGKSENYTMFSPVNNKHFEGIAYCPEKGKFAVIFNDITERINAEEQLKESEERYRTLFNISPDPIFVHQNNRILYANPSGIKLLGAKSFEELTKIKVLDFVHKDYRDIVTNRIKNIVENETLLPAIHEKFIKMDGSFVDVEVSGAPVIINGELAHLIVARDITERKSAEDELRKSEQKFRSIFENHSAVKLLIDPRTKNIVDANKAAEDYYGWTIEELKNMNLEQLNTISAEQISENDNKLEDKTYYEFRHKLKNGSIRDVEVYGSKLEIGGKVFLHSIIHDITERKLAEKELQNYKEGLEKLVDKRTKELDKANEKLKEDIRKLKEFEMMLKQALEKEKELSELKSRFISTASHEFRTPLTAILSSTELIQRYGHKWNAEKINDHLKRIQSSITNLTKLLDDVLTISRSDSGRILFNPELTDLPVLCYEIIQEINTFVNGNQELDFRYMIKEKTFYLDAKLLHFILTNLLSNAIKYSPGGGRITFLVIDDGDSINFTVKDEGIGIPEEDRKHLFEPFYRCNNVGEIAGTGLGLSIVKRSVELHKGRISCDSQTGKGTIFIINIPKKIEK